MYCTNTIELLSLEISVKNVVPPIMVQLCTDIKDLPACRETFTYISLIHSPSHRFTSFRSPRQDYGDINILDVGFIMDNVASVRNLRHVLSPAARSLEYVLDPFYRAFQGGIKLYKGDTLVIEVGEGCVFGVGGEIERWWMRMCVAKCGKSVGWWWEFRDVDEGVLKYGKVCMLLRVCSVTIIIIFLLGENVPTPSLNFLTSSVNLI